MLDRHNKLPIGLLLQKAGLITPEQLQNALELQMQYSQMKLGEILVLQQGIKVKTVDFFADKWQEIITLGPLFPLGYYLKKAYLLTEDQIKIILEEQKHSRDKFGVLAVNKGWIKQNTIDFFLTNLLVEPPLLVSLNILEKYNQNILHLEKKYADYSLILSRILAWTGGIPSLTETICRIFAQSNFNIPSGQEIRAVDQFVEKTLIRKWRTSEAAASIRLIQQSLLNNLRCSSNLLLTEYREILLSGGKTFQGTKAQKELLLMGLIVCDRDQLKVSNIIYQQVFDREFVAEQLAKTPLQTPATIIENDRTITESATASVESDAQTSIEIVPIIEPADAQVKVDSASHAVQNNSLAKVNSPEPLTRISSVIICAAIAFLIPLFLTINNYYSSLSRTEQRTGLAAKNSNRLYDSCDSLNVANLNLLLSSISELEANKEQFPQNFPDRCEIALNHFRVLAAPQLGRESRILEAIRHLCKVPPDSEMYVDAEVWLRRWYDSGSWGKETRLYLEETNKYTGENCPAAHFAEYKSQSN